MEHLTVRKTNRKVSEGQQGDEQAAKTHGGCLESSRGGLGGRRRDVVCDHLGHQRPYHRAIVTARMDEWSITERQKLERKSGSAYTPSC